nr:MAG: ORF1 [TTV-like mini virus]
MPPFYFYRRRWYPNQRWRRPRRYTRTRRFRQTVRRRFRRRNWVRRRHFKRRYKRKLSKITVKQWQPKKINNCNIKGNLCMFTCGRGRINHNFILTQESYVPTSEPGGGSWSILQMSLRVLFDEYIAGRNWWTKSNTALPLAKYRGCKLKFYRSELTDYIVTINRCPPFEVTLDSYLSTQPSRHLMNHNSFIVTKLGRGPNKKTYVKKKVPPPSLFYNKWFFAQDIYNVPLLMLTISATSLDQMYAPDDQISTNITLYSLNTIALQHANWEKLPYKTKVAGTQDIYLFTYKNGHNPNQLTWEDIVILCNTKQYTDGTPQKPSKPTDLITEKNKTSWGNPFTHKNQHKDSIIYYGTLPNQMPNNKEANLLPITSLYTECRYNPFKDKGKGNKVYLVPTNDGNPSFFTLPTNQNLIIENLPLWLIFWAWPEWILKSRPIANLNEDYQILVQSKYIYPQLPVYLFLDKYFMEPTQFTEELTETDKAHWHPKFSMQTEQLELIARTGPAAPKINHTKQIEAHFLYNFSFKWGGCPAPMETITDPADQEKFPTPSNHLQGPQIQNPGTEKQYYLYTFDEFGSTITKQAAKRLAKNLTLETYFTDYGAKDIPIKTQEKEDSSSEEEKTQTQERDLQLQLRNQRIKYRNRIRKLLKTKKYFPY